MLLRGALQMLSVSGLNEFVSIRPVTSNAYSRICTFPLRRMLCDFPNQFRQLIPASTAPGCVQRVDIACCLLILGLFTWVSMWFRVIAAKGTYAHCRASRRTKKLTKVATAKVHLHRKTCWAYSPMSSADPAQKRGDTDCMERLLFLAIRSAN